MTLIATLLESFDPPSDPSEGPGAEWLAGHAEGVEAGRAAQRAEAAALDDRLVQRIEDMAFAHAEARAGLAEALAPLFETLVTRLLPGLSDTILGAQLRAALEAEAARALDTPLELRLPENQVEPVSALFSDGIYSWLRPIADPGLAPGEAVITGPSRPETHLDCAATIDTAQQALAALCTPGEEETKDHG